MWWGVGRSGGRERWLGYGGGNWAGARVGGGGGVDVL